MIDRGVGVIIAVSLLLLPMIGAAIDSGPSNTVGFWKMELQPGFTQFSFPLLPNDKSLDNVLGDQLTGATTAQESDQIFRWDATAGQFEIAWFNSSSSSWTGDFDEVTETESYWIYVQPNHPPQMLVTDGNVAEEPAYNMGTIGVGYNAIGSVWAIPAPIDQAGLDEFTGGMYLFLSDIIMSYDANTGAYTYAWQDETAEWQGTLSEFEPLKGYWIYIPPEHTGFEWPLYPQPTATGLESRSPVQIYPYPDGHSPIPSPPMPVVKNQNPSANLEKNKTPSTSNAAKGGGR